MTADAKSPLEQVNDTLAHQGNAPLSKTYVEHHRAVVAVRRAAQS